MAWALLQMDLDLNPSSDTCYVRDHRVFVSSLSPSVPQDNADDPRIPVGERETLFATCLAHDVS